MEKKNQNNFNILKSNITLILIGTVFFSVLGATYAYFAASAIDNTTITGEAATVDLTLTVDRLLPQKSNTGVMVPQKSTSEDVNSPLATALKQGCVDDNTNVVCQVYQITIKNDGGTATEIVDGSVSFFSDAALTKNSTTTMPNLKHKLITSIDQANPNNSVLGTNADLSASSTPYKFATNVTLTTNQEYTYYMIIWFNETETDQIDEGNTFYGKIEFDSSNGTGVTSTF